MRANPELPPRFVNKRPQRRYLKIGIGIVVTLLTLAGLAFAALVYRAPLVELPSPTPLPPLPSVDFSGEPALIVEYGSNAARPQSSAIGLDLETRALLKSLSQASPSPFATRQDLPRLSASARPTVASPSLAPTAAPLRVITPEQASQAPARPNAPKRRSPNKVTLPTLPPADFSVTAPALKPIPEPNYQPASNPEGTYVLIGGGFSTHAQAEITRLALQSKGLKSKVIQENKQFRLQSLQQFQGPDAALQAADQLAQHGLDVTIRKLP